MKKLFVFALSLFLGIGIQAQNIELSNRLIQQYRRGQNEAATKDTIVHNHLWLSPLLRQAKRNWNDLTDEAKATFETYLMRPSFTGTELIYTSCNFAFHYTTNSGKSNEDVSTKDLNFNGVPDYVERMAQLFAQVSTLYHTTNGFTVPPSDGHQVNGAYYDVYISNKVAGPGVYGYVSPESYIGDNLNSPTLTETDAYTSYMVMRSNYSGFGDETIAMSVTVAHEYMHAVQMGYSGSMDSWFMEASATWSEDFAFPGYDDNFQYLPDVFHYPDVALNLEDGEAQGNYDGHWYGEWIFIKYLTEHADIIILKNIYQRCITYSADNAINKELIANWNSNLSTLFIQFAIANVLMTASSTYAPFTYARALDYNDYITDHGGYKIEHAFNFLGSDIDFNSQLDGNSRLMRLSSDIFTLTSDQNFNMVFTLSSMNAETDLLLLKIGTNSFAIETSEHNSSQYLINVTDNASWLYYIPLVYRIDKSVTNSTSVNYTLQITNAGITHVDDVNAFFKIYPNPADQYLNISTSLLSHYEVRLTDITGRQVKTGNIPDQSGKIDVQDVSDGIYLLQVIKNHQVIRTEKIMISHR